MNRQPFQTPPRWWSPLLSPFWMRLWKPLRLRRQLRVQRLKEVEVRGLAHLREALEAGHGVLITPNHPTHADSFAMYAAADQLGGPFYFMAAWQVLGTQGFFARLCLRHHGVFSVDREGIDRRALGQAVDILKDSPHPLVIFPEGEVYHINERVTPFREGPATIALMAAKRAQRPVVCIPCGLKYHYLEDPTPELHVLMDELEQEIFWRPRPELPLADRIYRLAEGLLALKELEYLGKTSAGEIPQRVEHLTETILARLEQRYGVSPGDPTVPERIKALRQKAIKQIEELNEEQSASSLKRKQLYDDLDDLFLVVQLFSYPGDYVAERPTVERLAETLDKFEEDALQRPTATIRACRAAVVQFGEPIPVLAGGNRRAAGPVLTRQLETAVQALLDGIEPPPDRGFGTVEQQQLVGQTG